MPADTSTPAPLVESGPPLALASLLAAVASLGSDGKLDRQREVLADGVRAFPWSAEVWDALGSARAREGDWPGALGAFATAEHLSPKQLLFALRRTDAALHVGAAEAELVRLALATSLDPLNGIALAAHGNVLCMVGRAKDGVELLVAAALLAPDDAEIQALLGRRLAETNRVTEAIPTLRGAIALGAGDPTLRNTLGAMLMRRFKHSEAYAVLQDLITDAGDAPVPLCNLAATAVSLGRQEEGVRLAQRAIHCAPTAILPRRALCNALPYRDGTGGLELLAAARAAAAHLPRRICEHFPNKPDPLRPLRVGLLSGSLRVHPVGWLTIAGFEALDPANFTLVGFSNRDASDPIAQRFRAVCADWHAVERLGDPALAAAIRKQSIDIVIDLGGYGDAGRMPALAYRAAPVQVKWVGMQNHSTGMPEIDWFLTDAWETPVGYERFYSEQLLRLPDGYVCYAPPVYAPDVTPLPALTRGAVTFGCLNNLAKITPRVIATWSRILNRLPQSRLVLKTHQFAERPVVSEVTAAFAAHGVSPAQLALKGSSPHREFLAEYNAIDIQLDPFPYSGGLTTCEALWMGVPTLTTPGELFASRHSCSHLSNVGLSGWIAKGVDDYERLAIEKASNLEALATLRATLRARVANSPLCDAQRFGQNLAAALRFAWTEWCDTSCEDHTGSPIIDGACGG